MALTYTPQPEHGTPMPEFSLPAVTGEAFDSKTIRAAPAKVVAFICGHCPYVQAIENRLINLAAKLKSLDVPFVGICSNDPAEYPEDAPDALLKRWKGKGYQFPYLIDTEQSVARSFGAVCTPDFFVYDKNNRLVYRGRLDDSWKDAARVTREELFEAVQGALNGGTLAEQIPSMGCSIKWREG